MIDTKTITNILDSTDALTYKVDDDAFATRINIRCDDISIGTFELVDGKSGRQPVGGLMPSSVGDGKNHLKILDVSISNWSDDGFNEIYEDESQLLRIANPKMALRYFILKTLRENKELYGFAVPEEMNGWYVAQWGTWKFKISTVEDVNALIAGIEDGIDAYKEWYEERAKNESALRDSAFARINEGILRTYG